MKELVCIICPRGCHLCVDEHNNVTGNTCPRGAKYAIEELTAPKRTVTSTVKCQSRIFSVCPVKTEQAIPKEKIFEVMDEINQITIKAPVRIGDVVMENVAGTGVKIVATSDILF